MRSDMAKVIVERPRVGSRNPARKKGYRKQIQATPFDELPRHEPMLGRWKGREKWLNEHLGPMRRFLRSNIGRPWNCVHRDLCEHVSFDNAVQGHVLAHIYEFVHLHVEVHDAATVYSKHGWRRHQKLAVNSMYVCPRTGILKVVRANRNQASLSRLIVDDFTQYHRRENVWWEVRVRSRDNLSGELWDVWLEKDEEKLSVQECIATYGSNLFATSKRPLSREENRRLRQQVCCNSKSER